MFPARWPLLSSNHKSISEVEAGKLIIMGAHLIDGVIVSALPNNRTWTGIVSVEE
jgi:hypothetical protein